MKNKIRIAISLLALSLPISLQAQYTKLVYISLPGPGNIQNVVYIVGKEKKFYALDPDGVMKRAEIEIVLLKERPNFKPEQFIDDRFLKSALKALAREPGAK
ncbi:MAG TPA: hypothetical protein VFU31_14650 [Candidatus Binatia bacterium]|nr:hypothetical protein [Candidatus Binatia bacterium]